MTNRGEAKSKMKKQLYGAPPGAAPGAIFSGRLQGRKALLVRFRFAWGASRGTPGAMFGRSEGTLWGPSCPQNRSKIDLDTTISKLLKLSSRAHDSSFFEDFRPLKFFKLSQA